tara:strand:+ start:2751 stop:3023 length:273 start_codon:yes stop_codon:yes gene_type:complete
MDKTNIEPSESLVDNLSHDLIDSMVTGIFSQVILSYAFGRSPSIKNIINKNTLIDGVKLGASIATYRRIGRPIIGQMLNRTPILSDLPKL